MEQKVKEIRIKIDDYFGTDDKETALWFFIGIGFPIICTVITLLVLVMLP